MKPSKKNKNHYVYRITNITTCKHYYGCRSTYREPKDDLGKVYFSSSKDRAFIADQKLNRSNYRYKIIRKFPTRGEAISLEIKLHDKFNVGKNMHFYNRAKQTSKGFDTSGKSFETEQSLERKRKRWREDNPNKYRDSTGKNNPMYGTCRTGIENPFFGKTHTQEARQRQSVSKLGKGLTEKTKEKLRDVWKKREFLECPYCGLRTKSRGNFNRYHGKNCKNRRENEDSE